MLAIARSISTLIFCSLFAVAAANAAQDDWLTYRHDSARSGAQPVASDLSDPARISGLHVVAEFPSGPSPEFPKGFVPGGFKASPIVVNGIAFIGGVNGYFYALDATSGALLWQYPKAVDHALIGSCGLPTDFAGGWGSYGIPSSATYAKINGQDAVIFGAPDPDPGTDGGAGSARLFALPLSADPNNPQPIWESDIVARVDCSQGSTLHERIAYSSPLVLGDTIYVGIHDTGDNPIQQGRVAAVDLNTGHLTGFQFLGVGNTPGDGHLGGGVWNALATDGTGVYFTTGNTQPFPWCMPPYGIEHCPLKVEPPNNNGLSLIRVDKDKGAVKWAFQPVPFFFDGDPDWAAGATVMSTSCGELIASVQKDGWSYAIDANTNGRPSCPLTGNSWQFPPTTGGCQFTDHSQVHGDDDYRRPGAAWGDVFIVRTGGEANTDGTYRGYSELHALNACATKEQDRVRWIAEIPNTMAASGHISYSSPTVTGGIVFIGTNQDPNDKIGQQKGHLVVLADPTVAPASQQTCSDVNVHLTDCKGLYAPVPSLQPLADIPMPDGGSLASMRNEPVLAEGRVFVATTPNADFPGAGHVYILAPGCSCDFFLNPAINQFYHDPNNCPIRVAQSGASQSTLFMSGPWVASDHGVNANGLVVDTEVDRDSLPNGSTISLAPGHADIGPGGVLQSDDGLMGIQVSVPASASVGQYCVDVATTDPATRVSAIAAVPIQIYNCKPLTACPAGACGIFPTGCGGNLQCGVCKPGLVCTGGGCCNPFVEACGERCPPGQQFCFKTKSCVPQGRCPT